MDAVAVSSGPGSYTGLRIGTSVAKGLCYSLDIPLISVGSLEVKIHGVNKFNIDGAVLCPMIDARRMEVYCQVVDEKLEILQPVEAKIIDENSFSEFLERKKVFFFGDGSAKCATIMKSTNAIFLENIFPSAATLGMLAYCRFQVGQTEDLVTFEPFYLKDFVAKKAIAKF